MSLPRLPWTAAWISLAIAAGVLLLPLLPVAAAVVGTLVVTLLLPLGGEGALMVLIPLFSRLDPQALADQHTRAQILDRVRKEPGVSLSEVAQRVGIGWGTAVHHLNLLERNGTLVSHAAGRHRRFFLQGEDAKLQAHVFLRSNPTKARVGQYVIDHPGATQREIAQALGISAPLAHRYLSGLAGEGFVRQEREWRSVHYYAIERLAGALNPPVGPSTVRPQPPVGATWATDRVPEPAAAMH